MSECKRCGFPDGMAMHTCRPKDHSAKGRGTDRHHLYFEEGFLLGLKIGYDIGELGDKVRYEDIRDAHRKGLGSELI